MKIIEINKTETVMRNLSILFMFICVLCLFLLNGCGKTDKEIEEKEHSKEEAPQDEHSSEVALTDEQIKVMAIATEKLDLQNISGYIKVNGEVAVNPDQESKVGSIIPGRIRKIYVKEGSFVRAGQTLAVIENPQLIDMQVEYINAKNEYEYSKKEYERQLKLSSDNIGSKKTLNE
ncbi:MAG: efflux RND transporter periplasmic adaptor subunit, partial [Ignavibacteria bacterium]|nr:efflux RND transporter periplasmic adaptor subunit [Ignavibacteria bacterium]